MIRCHIVRNHNKELVAKIEGTDFEDCCDWAEKTGYSQELFTVMPAYKVESLWREQLKKVEQCYQRQDSVLSQLQDLIEIANKFGFYGAANFIATCYKTVEKE